MSEMEKIHQATEKRRQTPVGLACNGCTIGNLNDVRRGISWASETSPKHLDEALRKSLRISFRNKSEEIVMYLVTEANAPIDEIEPGHLNDIRSLRLWETILARGWDINTRTRRPGSRGLRFRLIDYVCADEDLVRWCLDHGALLDDREKDSVSCPALLQTIVQKGSLKIYKMLMERGAPHGPRELHFAVRRVSGSVESPLGMELVRFLVDELGFDVNQLDGDEFYYSGDDMRVCFGPPLFYAVRESGGEEVVRFLLERGADPYLSGDAFEEAKARGNDGVLAVLQEWKDGKIQLKQEKF